MPTQDIFVLSDRSEDDPMCGTPEPTPPWQPFDPFDDRHSMTEEVHAMEWTDVSDSEGSEAGVAYHSGVTRFQSTPTSPSQCSTSARLFSPLTATTAVRRQGRRGEGKTNAAGYRPPPARKKSAGASRSPLMASRPILESVDGNRLYKLAAARSQQADYVNDESSESDDEALATESGNEEPENDGRRLTRSAAKEADAAQRKRDREEAKVAREADRSLQKGLSDANRLRASKVDALREIEVHLSYDLSLPSSPIASAMPEFKMRLEEAQCSFHFLSEEDTIAPGTIRFLRRVKAVWDPETKLFHPLDEERVEWEPTLAVVTSVDAIVDHIAESDDMFVEWLSDIRLTVTSRPHEQMFLLVKGLAKYHTKTVSFATNTHRDVIGDFLQEEDTDVPQEGARTDVEVTKAMVEEQLLRASVGEHVFIVLVDDTEEIEDWLFNLAGDVAVRPYKRLTKSHLAFSAPDQQSKGEEPLEVLELMLQEVPGITQAAALGITSCYPSLRGLMEAYEDVEEEAGPTMLEGCPVRTSANGVATARQLGPSLSEKVYEILRGDDPLALL